MQVDYNEIIKFKKEIEKLYQYLKFSHENILKMIEDIECIDDEKFDMFHSLIKEYESKIEIIKSDFLLLNSENKKIESCLSQVKLLKKKRLTKIKSNMCDKSNDSYDDDEDDDLPF